MNPDSQRHARRGRSRRSNARSICRLTTLLLACLLAAACGSSGASNATSSSTNTAANKLSTRSQVTLRIGDAAGTGAKALLTAAGLLGRLPVKVAWSDFPSGPPMLQALSAGALDIGGVGDAPPVFAAAGGAKIAIVGSFDNNPNKSALIVPHGSSIHSIAQLRGKKIAVVQGSSADYHLLTVLTKAGLGVHDVHMEYLQPAAGIAALTSGSADAWDIWSPFIEQAMIQDRARILVNGDSYGSNYVFVVASRASLVDPAKAAAIAEYLKLLDQAQTWANTHPQAWAKVWASATGLPASIMLAAARDATATPVPITSTIIASEQGVVDAFYAAGLIRMAASRLGAAVL